MGVFDTKFNTQVGPVRTLQVLDSSFAVSDLSTCQAYWATTTAVNCGSSIRSEVIYIEVHDSMEFKATIDLGDNGPCNKWVTTNLNQKYGDAQRIFLGALNLACSYLVSCIANSTFSCRTDESTKVKFV